jgi:hypothetical protein
MAAKQFLKPQDYSARTGYRPPAPWYKRLNGVGVVLTSLGLAPRGAVTLIVRGRRSGKLRRVPVMKVTRGESDYLVAIAGESGWVRNVRASGGRVAIRRRRERKAHLEELPVEKRALVIDAYLRAGEERGDTRAAADQARFYFGLDPEPSLEQIDEIAAFYPVFRIDYV